MSALPPVRTGGKKPPAAGAQGPKKAPGGAGPNGGSAAPSAAAAPAGKAAGKEDTKARVAREREERMAAVKAAKQEQQAKAVVKPPGSSGGGAKTARAAPAAAPAATAATAGGAKKTPPASARAPAKEPATGGKTPAAAKAPPAAAAAKKTAAAAAPPAGAPPKRSPRRASDAAEPAPPSADPPAKSGRKAPAAGAAAPSGNGGAAGKKVAAPPAKTVAGGKKQPATAATAAVAAPGKWAAKATPTPPTSASDSKKPAKAPAKAPATPEVTSKQDAEAKPDSAAQSTEAPPPVATGDEPLKKPAEHFKLDGPEGIDVTSELTKNLVYECFPGEGTCFRVVERTGPVPRWSFYNDTEDMEIHAEVSFNKGSKITALGTAKLTEDKATGKVTVKDTILPGATQPFSEGRATGYACAYSGDEVSQETKTKLLAAASASLESEVSVVERLVKQAGVDAADEEAVLALCLKEDTPYVDLNFKPGPACFFREGKDEKIEIFPMQRPMQYLPESQRKNIALINTVEPNDIDQGLLGDCWFLCAISSLAEFPDKCSDLFEHPVSAEDGKKEMALGAYRIALLHNGWWHNMIVDDFLPTQGGRAAFAKNIEDPGELWVSLLEKAYAKIRGSFSTIIGGDPLHALEDLTGYPTSRLDRKFNLAYEDEAAADALFLDLLRYDEAGYLVTVGTPSPNPDDEEETKEMEEKYDEAGLTVDHSYSVIVVKHFAEKGIKLLKIRNPWGNEREWEGAWGDNSEEWKEHPEVAKACEFDGPSSDGTFWMQWSDAMEYFDTGGVCFMSNDWYDCRTRGSFVQGVPTVALKITCRRQCKAFLVLNQAAEPGFDPAKPDAKYCGAMVSVWRKDAATGAYKVHLNSTSDFDAPKPDFTFLVGRSIGLLYTFEPSEEPYFVVPRGFNATVNKDYCFGIISDESCGTKERHALKVEFTKLDSTLKAFENFDTFALDPATQAEPVDADYQVNPEVGAPYTAKGPSVVIQTGAAASPVEKSL